MNAIANYLGCIPIGWETRPIMCDGIYYGDVMLQDNEIHVAVSPKYWRRGWSRRIARSVFAELLADKVFLTTRSRVGDDTEPFIRRLGFIQTNEDATYRYWWLDSLPFERKHHAQQGT